MSDRCPLWVKSGHSAILDGCPLYPQERTLASVRRRAFGAENSLLVARFETKSIRWLARAASMRGSKNSYRPPSLSPANSPGRRLAACMPRRSPGCRHAKLIAAAASVIAAVKHTKFNQYNGPDVVRKHHRIPVRSSTKAACA